MHVVFLAVLIAGSVWFGACRRRPDVYTLAFAAAFIYFLPGTFGYTNDPSFFYEALGTKRIISLDAKTHIVMTMVIASIWASAWIWDQGYRNPKIPVKASSAQLARDQRTEAAFVSILMMVSYFSLVMVVWTCGSNLVTAEKDDFLASINRWFLLWSSAIVLLLPAAVSTGHRNGIIVGVIMLLLSMYFGSRSEFAIAIMATFLVQMSNASPVRIVLDNPRRVIAGLILGMTVFVYKSIQYFVKTGDYEVAFRLLGEWNTYATSVTESEPFVTQVILNEVLARDFVVDSSHYFGQIIVNLLPFGNVLSGGGETFNSCYQPVLFPDVRYGMAGNCWAQVYASFGWIGLLLFVVCFNVVLAMFQSAALKGGTRTRVVLMVMAAYWSFFFHRNDIGFQITIEKRILVIGFACGLVSTAMMASRLGISRQRAMGSTWRGIARPTSLR